MLTEEQRKKIEDIVKLDMESGIDAVLNGTESSWTSYFVSPNQVKDYIISRGARARDDFETNGWDWDFWETFRYGGFKYQMSGSGFFGGITVTKSDDQDEDDEDMYPF